MTERERVEALAEELVNASFCWNCLALCRAGEACPNGCDDIPDEVIYSQSPGWSDWIARLRAESEGGGASELHLPVLGERPLLRGGAHFSFPADRGLAMRGFLHGLAAFLFCLAVFVSSIAFFALWVGFTK